MEDRHRRPDGGPGIPAGARLAGFPKPMNSAMKFECAHLYVVGDTRCRICLQDIRSGLLYWSSDRATVGLEVKNGVVVDAPPYARKWALGRTLAELPPAKESVLVTDTDVPTGMDAEGVDWPAGMDDSVATWTPDDGGMQNTESHTSYPEYPDNPHNHRFTVSLAPDKPPFVVVRGNTAAEITAALNELDAYGVYANLGAAYATLRAQGAVGNGLGPVSPAGPPQAAPAPQVPSSPGFAATPPPFGPNVSVPNAPGYQGPPPGQSFPSGPPAQGGGWGGRGGSGPQEKPRPAGWAMVDVPFNDKDRFKALRAQGTETGNYLRGKIQWGGKGTYWLDPSVAGWIAQQGFPVSQ